MKHCKWAAALITLYGWLFCQVPAFASNGCVDCHKDEKFKVQNKLLYDYYKNWENSPHEIANVSCVDCHGGNTKTHDKVEAHLGLLPQSDPKSPVYYKNIPATCGRCHS
ncbi:MAG: hypothetical protein HY537_06035, partial [Deltaproteobacteria bacterium]|nr:hypothetical protein [Deltaproteobacteria bacterium]